MAEYTPLSDTSTCLREAQVERDLLRRRLHQMQEQSNRDEDKNRALNAQLKVARSTISALEEIVSKRDETIAELRTLIGT